MSCFCGEQPDTNTFCTANEKVAIRSQIKYFKFLILWFSNSLIHCKDVGYILFCAVIWKWRPYVSVNPLHMETILSEWICFWLQHGSSWIYLCVYLCAGTVFLLVPSSSSSAWVICFVTALECPISSISCLSGKRASFTRSPYLRLRKKKL